MVAHRQAHDPHLASPQTRRRLRLRCCGRAAVIDGAEPAAQRRPAEGARPLGHGELCLTTTVSAPAPHSCPRALYARRCPYAQRCPAPVAAAVARARRSRAERRKPGGRCRPGASRSTTCTAPGDTTENRRWRKPDLALPPRRLALGRLLRRGPVRAHFDPRSAAHEKPPSAVLPTMCPAGRGEALGQSPAEQAC